MSIDKYKTLNQERKIQHTKKKVAAYCRVSTDNEDQANSFESQQRYFRQYIDCLLYTSISSAFSHLTM